jgi:lysozyme
MRIFFATIGVVGFAALAGVQLYRSGQVQLNRPQVERYPIIGIDVSHHQGEIDWAAVSSSGVKFAFIKATEGRDHVDSRFATNWRRATDVGIPTGPYHFFTFCAPGAAQAENFLRAAPPSPDSLPPVADVEFVGNCKSWSDASIVRAELGIFLESVERAWGVRTILYTTPDALDRIVSDQFQGHPIWIRSVFFEPDLGAYRGWRIWQFSDNSRIPGISGPVDQNALRPGSSLSQLRESAG